MDHAPLVLMAGMATIAKSDKMRPNNQNKNRSRGRSSGRKHANPMSRNYESNGPDVKIRGNAAHIAEKYVQLARDAQAAGDSVMAENYLQHAEHYFRIISAAQAQMTPRSENTSADDDTEREDKPATRSDNGRTESTEAAEAKADAETPGEPGSGKDADEKPRARRPRRRKVSETPQDSQPAEDGSETKRRRKTPEDKGASDQPDVGELPAFLTGAGSAAE